MLNSLGVDDDNLTRSYTFNFLDIDQLSSNPCLGKRLVSQVNHVGLYYQTRGGNINVDVIPDLWEKESMKCRENSSMTDEPFACFKSKRANDNLLGSNFQHGDHGLLRYELDRPNGTDTKPSCANYDVLHLAMQYYLKGVCVFFSVSSHPYYAWEWIG